MSERSGLEIAIIGIAGRFPKAADLNQFWQNLRTGVEGVSFFTEEEVAAAGISPAQIANPNYVKAAAIIDGIELFDADFFGISAREAEILDPQHRLFLECAWEVLEKAGYVGTRRCVGVFGGSARSSYVFNLLRNSELLDSQGHLAISVANEKDFLVSRVAYKLGLEGPSVTVQTACSTSLMAVHLACQSLLAGECELALAGGISVWIPQKGGYLYQRDSISSPDGHCRTFDAAAKGTVGGQGFGMVVLRLLEDALDAGDHIHAIIKGSASNNDGSMRAGFTAPSRDGQARVIAAAQMRAEVEADSIGYVEAHGTATPLGDPIEVAALTKAFRETTDRRGFCALGSVKTGIGHLDAAAGIAGMIKTVLALEHQEIPPSLHFETPNPEIDFDSSPFYVVTRPTPWPVNGHPRRAGVSSFGLGGTNVHVILEEAPPLPPPGPSRSGQILILSTRSAGSLESATDNLAVWLEGHPEAHLADVAYTLQVGRVPFPHRRVLVATHPADAAVLASRDPRRVWTAEVGPDERPVAFLLPGVGDHYPGMAQGLYRTERVFREELDRCAELLRPHLSLDLREALFAGTSDSLGQGLDLRALLGRGGQAPDPSPLHETQIIQPAVVAVSWALAQLWISWGVQPRALLGYSLGEYTAACLAGVVSLEDGLTLVARRARLIAGLPPGAMLAVPLSETDLLPRLTPGLSLAAENGPGVSVIAGPLEAVDALERQLTSEGLSCRRLPTTHAFHSAMMEPVRETLAEMVAGLRMAPPSIPYLSNVTGTWITAEQATDPLYWADHLCRPVRFGRALETLWAQSQRVLLEVGPGQGLSTLALQHPAQRGGLALASLRHSQDRQPDDLFLLGALARLWLAGVPVDWEGFAAGETRRRVPLPTYPFERRPYWIDAPRRNGLPAAERQTHPPAAEDRTADAIPAPALPARHERPRLPNPYVPPATPEQQQLAALWQELLGIAPVGLYDNFFALGGHSLLGTQLMTRLRATFSVDLPLSTLFENPTVADMVHAFREPVKGTVRPPLRPRPAGLSDLPLSFAQQRLWFLQQMDPASPMYNMPFAFRLSGPLAAPALDASLTAVVRRHETLRTTLVLAGDGPVQSIAPPARQPLPLIDLSALPAEVREEMASRLSREEARQPFDLACPPVVRTLLLRLEEREHDLLFTIHHVSGDGWSVNVLSRELVELYGAAVEGRPARLPELPVQYADFAVWQRSWLHGEVLEAQIEYWRRQLAGAPALLEMPLDRPRSPVQSFRSGRRWAHVPAELSSSLAALGRLEEATGFMTLLAAFQALLHRYGGQESVVVGAPIANRERAELERLIGFFANTLALRADFVGDPGFDGLLAQVREMALGAYAHQDLPFEKLVDELAPQRDTSYAPVFQALFAYQNAPRQAAGLRDLSLRQLGTDEGVARFDLTLVCAENISGLAVHLDYNAELFEVATADRLLRLFVHLLAQVAGEPQRPVGDLALLDEEERRQVVLACNATACERAEEELCLHGLFERQAALTPKAPAVVGDDGVVCYGELSGWAGRIAERLRRLGIGAEDRVGVCLERSAAALAALLGTLRAGAAYVPLDPEWPRERLAAVAADAGLVALLTRSGLAAARGLAPREVLVEEARRGARAEELPQTRPVTPEAAAYAIYTSGSTGAPKGAVTSHRAAANFVLALGATLGLAPGDRLLLFAPLSFDASVLQIFPALSCGAAVVVHPNPRELAGAELLGFCTRHEVTVLDLPAALWRQWIEDMAAAGQVLPGGIRAFLTGGESVPAARVRAWAGLTRRQSTFLSSYGPTEATVTATVFLTDSIAAFSMPECKVPIGHPLANVRAYVLDARMRPVPTGVAGELYLAGDGLARGYLGQPGLTAASFVPDAAGDTPGGRLYRTGDLARRLPGGDLEFLGRADTQVKIRGFRLELSEVEAVLSRHPDLAECVAAVREDRPGDRRLVAYVVPQPGRAPGVPELRSFVAERLPQHMVPSTIVALSALPVLASGKVDRAALPAPEHHRAEEGWLAPRTPVEEVLAGIWAELLGLERAGAADDFFELGGHSLLATQVMSRLRAAFGVEMPLRDLFEAPALADLAARVEAALRDGAGLLTPPLIPGAPALREGQPLPLSFAQQRLWFIDQLEPSSPLYNIPVALRVEGPLHTEVLALCLSEIVRRHETLRTVFAATGGSAVQVIQPAKPFRLTVVDLSGLSEKQREALALTLTAEEAARPFDLGRGPLLRAMLLRLAAGDQIAALTMHHIVGDGWSMGILVREVTALYAAFSEGRPSPLPELPVQYADFAAWQASWLHGATLEGEISFWRRQLAGLPPHLELPTDRPRPAVQSFRGASRPVRLPAGLTRQAQALSRREGATLFMVLLAGLQALLARTSGQPDLAVGTPVAGRNRVETEDLIGFFVNTLVLRGDLTVDSTGGPSFRDLLGRVRETSLAAHTHQDVPFEKLVQELSPERSLAHTPLFQVVLALQNAPVGMPEIRELRLRPVSRPATTAKFDLTLILEERGGGLRGAVEYATDLFDAATIDRLIIHYERLLTAALAEPERGTAELLLLPDAERHQVLVEWNDSAAGREEERAAPLIHEPFEAWARQTPDAVAAVWHGETLTYGALDRRADRLARHLEHLGAGPGSLIGIHLRRGPDLIVAVLAVLKAGAAYVPLEIGHPPARLRWILETLDVSCLLTETAQQDSLPALPHVICLDRDFNRPIQPIRSTTARRASPDDLAYIIFTSGSTGTPKGVMVRHRPVLNLLRWAHRAFAFSPADRVLFVTSLSFDLSVFDIFGLLGAGGSIRIADDEEIHEPERLLQALAEEPVTFWDSAPAALEQTVPFLPGMEAQARPALRLVFLSGDWIPVTLPDRIRERFPGARVVALGGATEATVWSNVFPVERVEPSWTSIPYGRPIENARYHVLDDRLAPCPVSVPGDLYIGGDCLADGYAREPVLTAHKFLPDPWSSTPGRRLYRTGDRARYRPDGNLEFLGRLDHQVKIRGFRIELGEIEAALATLPGVREAVVVVRADGSGRSPVDRRLVAYLVGDASPDALRHSLRERLPEYMVPAAFVTLATLPLTANGKVDRKALPAPEQPGERESYLAPRTREEELLAAVWAQVLRLPRVGVNDNFFELGGDSILSVQIVARARQAGLLFTVRQIFEHQTVAELARHATDADAAARAEQGPVAGEVPLTPIQRWFFVQGFADLHHFNQALVLEPREPLAPAALESAMAAIVEHHDALRLRFLPRDGVMGGWRQENAAAEPATPLHRVDLSRLPAPRSREAFERAAAALQMGFDLSAGPLIRLALFAAGTGQPQRLLWVAHHLVVDGVSWRVLLADLEGAYRQAARGLRASLPPKTTSFQEWARRLAEHAGSDALAGELEHWCETARATVPLLPADFPPGGETVAGHRVGDEAAVTFELTAAETSDLLQTVPSVYHNRIDEALLSALARALAGWTGSPRLRVDLEGHGREPIFDDLDISRTVGWFTTLYPVVLEAGDTGPGDSLMSAKERLRAVPERGIGYGLLRYLRDARDSGNGETARLLAAAPAAEISFNYLGQVDATTDELSLFRVSMASAGPLRSPRAHRTHQLGISGMVAAGRLRITLIYCARMHRRETVERMAAAYAGALRQLIQHSRECRDEVFTPSDFPRARLDARSFKKLALLLSDPKIIAEGPGLTLENVEDIYPLSPLQNGMLFHSLMEPESGVYVNQVTCTLPADLDPRLFRRAWERLVERQGALRTVFFWDGLDEARQVVRKSCALPWQDLDWRGLSADERQRHWDELRQRDRHTPLILSEAPLMRFSLIRLDHEHGFIWTFHHLLMDGWSLPILVQELGAVFAALQEGREPALPPARPFSDYIGWLQKQDQTRAEPFWRAELAGFTAPNSLGLDRAAEAAGAASYAERRIRASRAVTADLQALAARHKLTLQTITLGAWAVLIGRYSNEADVVFGGVVSGRPAALPGVESMIGMFVNTLAVRVRVNDAEPLAPWLQRLQEHQLARQEFEHSPLAQIQRWSEVPFGSPLFETLYVFENYPTAGDGSPSGLRIGNLRSFENTNYPVTLLLAAADQMSLQVTFDRTRVGEEMASRLLHHLGTLLAGMAEGPERSLRDLPLLSESERHQLRVEWNDTAVPRAWGGLLHDLFEVRASSTPDAAAATFEGETLTYAGLDARANQLARHLRGLGCGPESRVGVALERTLDLLVALLGVLKAGAVYVPLDPEYPRDRLAFLLEDSRPAALLTQENLLDRLPIPAGLPVAIPAALSMAAESEPGAHESFGDDCLAYTIYTSGSTGRPKGAMVTHGGMLNHLGAKVADLGLERHSRVAQTASPCFDISVWQLLAPLLAGGSVHIASASTVYDPELLLRFVARERITVLEVVPSLLRGMVDFLAVAGGAVDLSALQWLIATGEACAPDLALRWLELAPHTRLLNAYGPTECSDDVTHYRLARPDPRPALTLPIGRPVANTRIHVLDSRGQPVAPGIAGELCVAGRGVGRGYLGLPARTAEVFVPDALSGAPGARLYRTGDLARWLPDGTLEYLGRLDHQVKIRGFRIELGEIEAVLSAVDGVDQAVVIAREDTPGDQRLVAYVAGDVAPGVLSTSLRERLPDYMVPAAFVTLAALPLTPNGKVDRKSLPAPEWQASHETWLAPRTPAEEILAGIWAEILDLQRVGATDHFFDLGGHSLLATQARSRIREAFGVDLPLRTLFEQPVLADLAAEIEALGSSDSAPRRVPIPRAGRQGPLPLSLNQQRFWFLQQLNPASSAFNLSSAVRFSGRLDGAALEASFGEIVRRHSAVRTRIVAVAGVPHQIVDPPGTFILSRGDLAGLDASVRDGELRRLAQGAAQRPFDLAGEPPLQVLLLRLEDDDHAVLLSLHHTAGDGWSLDILTRELGDLYMARIKGRPSPLPELPIQYADWVIAQQEWLRGPGGAEQLAYWRRKLGGDLPVLTLPMQRQRPPVRRFRGSRQPLILGPSLSADLAALSRSTGSTLFMCLLAAFKTLLHLVTGGEDLLVGTHVANREWPGTEGLIGLFVNDLALRTDVSGRPSFRELLARVRETALQAYAHQDLPFETLQAELRPDRSAGPLFQVLFMLQNAPVGTRELPGLTLASVPAERRTANFDLTLTLTERADGLHGAFVYDIDLFEASTVARLSEHFVALLREVVSDPDRPLPSLSFASPAAAREMVVSFSEDL